MPRRLLLLALLLLLACGEDTVRPVRNGEPGAPSPSPSPAPAPPPAPAPTPPPAPAPPPPPSPEPPPPNMPPPPPAYPPPAPAEATIWIADANGRNERKVTVGRMPVWAPDGSRLLVVDEMQLRLVDTTGQVLGTLGSGAAPAWSRDGSRIAFVTDAGIAVMNADGTGGRTILPHLFRTDTWPPGDMGVGSPTWSPDGRRIAFEHLGDGDTRMAQVFVMNADGSDPRPLVQFSSAQYGEGDPSWSPDGAWIAIWNWWYGLARVPAIGGVPTTLYRNFPAVSWGTRPAWSPDGTSIAFTANWFTPNKPEIWAIPAMGGLPVRLVYDGYQPAWSPDGRRIAFGRMVVP